MSIEDVKFELQRLDSSLESKQNTNLLDKAVKSLMTLAETTIYQRSIYKVRVQLKPVFKTQSSLSS